MFEKILACLDGSELAEQILPYATEQAARLGSTLVLLHVLPEPTTLGLNVPGEPALEVETSGMQKRLQIHSEADDKYLKSLAEKIAQRGIKVDYALLPGRAGEAIVDYAVQNDIGLIAIATHGRGGLGRAIFGSVADYVLRNSSLPVLLIRTR
jgi:nucleotide-binding universal stress UspA family protein